MTTDQAGVQVAIDTVLPAEGRLERFDSGPNTFWLRPRRFPMGPRLESLMALRVQPDPSRRELETFNNLVDDMFKRFSTLVAMLDETDVGTDDYFKTMNVYVHFVTHLAGVLRVGRSLGESPDDVLEMLGQAAQELAEEHGWSALLPD